LDGLGLGHEENVPEGIVLSSIIKDAEKELNEIADIIDEAIGNVCIFYKEDKCYNNFYEREVAGLAFLPADKKAKEVSA
jgi:hypothetical protein